MLKLFLISFRCCAHLPTSSHTVHRTHRWIPREFYYTERSRCTNNRNILMKCSTARKYCSRFSKNFCTQRKWCWECLCLSGCDSISRAEHVDDYGNKLRRAHKKAGEWKIKRCLLFSDWWKHVHISFLLT